MTKIAILLNRIGTSRDARDRAVDIGLRGSRTASSGRDTPGQTIVADSMVETSDRHLTGCPDVYLTTDKSIEHSTLQIVIRPL